MDTQSLDKAVADLAGAKDKWAHLPIGVRLDYLERVRVLLGQSAEEWVDAAVAAKGTAGTPLAGEEWISGPYGVLSWINAVMQTLKAVDAGTDPLAGLAVRQRADGQTVLRVSPYDYQDKLLLNGFGAEVWMTPGITPGTLRADVATKYQEHDPAGQVALVLGAGNIASIAPLDVLYKLYADGEVVVLKMNPVNDYLGPVLEKVFAPLVADGYLRFVYGGADVGDYLCTHELVDTIHMTGSERTHDAIVYGTGADAADRKKEDRPRLTKPVTSELGGVGPTIVVPGPWSAADIAFQAEHIATQKLHNSGFNCIAAQVLVLPAGWDGSAKLVSALRDTMRTVQSRPAYYPGADDRRAAVAREYSGAEELGGRTLVCDVDASDSSAYAFTQEFFTPALATTTLPGADPAEFLRNAVAFANDTLHGTLGANILIHPRTAAALGPALEEAIADLRYGTIAVNAWTGVGYNTPRATWGAFPGHTRDDVQSGVGVVHNALLLGSPQKTVVTGPFRPFPRSYLHGEFAMSPRPPWFVTNRTAELTGRRLTAFAADGNPAHLPAIFASALRG